MLLSFLLPVAERALNKFLALDPAFFAQLAPLQGTVICVRLRTLDVSIYLQAQTQGVQLMQSYALEPAVTLTGTPLAFLRLTQAGMDSAALLESEITVTGDIAVAQQFKQVFSQLDVDLEEQLARFTGDAIAHQVGRALRNFVQWARRSRADLREDTTDYLQVEQQLVPPQTEVQGFMQQVDATRDAVERLRLRVQHLQLRAR